MFANRVSPLWIALALALPGSRTAAQDVFVVAKTAAPGVDFTSLGAAILAAGEGDTILMRAGSYSTEYPVIDAKSLSVVADPEGAAVTLHGELKIQHLSDDQFVAVRGVDIFALPGEDDPPLQVVDNLGSVWLEDCAAVGKSVSSFLDPPGPGATVDNSAHVVMTRCAVYGGTGGQAGYGVTAMFVDASNLRIFDSRFVGGANICGGHEPCPSGGSASGIFVDGGSLLIEGSEVYAGNPGEICFPAPFCFPYPAGPAIRLHSNSPSLLLFDTTFPVAADPPVQVDSGSSTTLPGTSRDFTATSPARVGQPLTLAFSGASGDQVWMFFGLTPTDVLAPAFKGALLVGTPNQLVLLAALPGSGTLTLQPTVPTFPAALESLPLVLQAAFRSGGQSILSEPGRVVLLNAGF